MSIYSTRVELHNAVRQDYENLHGYMEQAGFARTIVSDTGVAYHLPTAEYIISGNLTIEQVTDSAMRAASKTGKSHAVFVTEAVRWRFAGLAPVKRAA